jgi:hypothetical protein
MTDGRCVLLDTVPLCPIFFEKTATPLIVNISLRVLKFTFSRTMCTFGIDRTMVVGEFRGWLPEDLTQTNDNDSLSPFLKPRTIGVISEGLILPTLMYSDLTAVLFALILQQP